MIRAALNTSAPILAVAGGDLYGIGSDKLGTGLLILMALAVILNQLWTLFEKARKSIRNPEADFSGLATADLCEQRHKEIEHLLDALKLEDARQDRINKEQFQTVTVALGELRHEVREDIKGLHKRSDDVLRAVSRLEGKVQ